MNVTAQRRASLLRPLVSDINADMPAHVIGSRLRAALQTVDQIEHAQRARTRKAAEKARRNNRAR